MLRGQKCFSLPAVCTHPLGAHCMILHALPAFVDQPCFSYPGMDEGGREHFDKDFAGPGLCETGSVQAAG